MYQITDCVSAPLCKHF
ncbi:hypothetical protein QZH41_017298 [Actinostola sp. cb2023]|nr:hypothetical protein QZH41_017298 [Actinostola sp. cb2023]